MTAWRFFSIKNVQAENAI